MRLTLRFDMRHPDLKANRSGLYAAMIDICEWADGLGFDEVFIGEHHAAEDGYIPQPIVLASAVAARTKNIKLHISAMLVTMYHPLHLAEMLSVLDIVSNGRARITAGMGYRPHEFEMFGIDMKKRLRVYLDNLEVLRQAWTGEPFEFQGHTVQVTPMPVQKGGPKVFIGGSTEQSAERAAKMGYDYMPPHPSLYEVYKAELAKLGKPVTRELPNQQPYFLYVTDNPARDWEVVGPSILFGINTYAKWAAERGAGATLYATQDDLTNLKKDPLYQVITPNDCVALAKSLEPNGELHFQPLFGGLDPAITWKSLKLFEKEVLPRLRSEGLRP